MGEANRRRGAQEQAPIAQYSPAQMQALAKALDELFNAKRAPRRVGFALLVFPFGETTGGRVNYTSNGADRRDMATLFKEVTARWQGQPEQEGRA